MREKRMRVFPTYMGCRLSFSGHKEGPEAYKKWEKAMAEFFFAFSIPNHLKVQYAKKTLKGEAAEWWEDEIEIVDYYGDTHHTWSSMKSEMYEEFVINATSQDDTESASERILKTLEELKEHVREMMRKESNSKQVSRTKLFEEGENDTESESSKKTPEFHSVKKEVNNNLENSRENLSTISGHLEGPSKWNHGISSSDEKDMDFTSQESCKTSGLDQHVMIEAPRSNHEELSSKPTCPGILTQKGSCESLNQTKPKSEEEVIQVTSQPDSDFAKPDLLALSGVTRSEVIELSDKSSCFEILTHKRVSETLNHINQSFNEGVMDFSNKCNLQLPYLEAHEFGGDQGIDWRPEDILIRLEASKKTPRCILSHWIIDFQSIPSTHQDFPIQAHGASNMITCNQLFPTTHGRPRMLLGWSKIVPRHSSYGPKLSRLKNIINLPYFG